jgi:hypothetical protein
LLIEFLDGQMDGWMDEKVTERWMSGVQMDGWMKK